MSSKALGLYKQIDKEEIKTEVSYYLAQILEEKYGQDSDGLRKKLPQYILDAFNHLGMIKE